MQVKKIPLLTVTIRIRAHIFNRKRIIRQEALQINVFIININQFPQIITPSSVLSYF